MCRKRGRERRRVGAADARGGGFAGSRVARGLPVRSGRVALVTASRRQIRGYQRPSPLGILQRRWAPCVYLQRSVFAREANRVTTTTMFGRQAKPVRELGDAVTGGIAFIALAQSTGEKHGPAKAAEVGLKGHPPIVAQTEKTTAVSNAVAVVPSAVTPVGCRHVSYRSASIDKCLNGCFPKSQVMAPATRQCSDTQNVRFLGPSDKALRTV